MARQYWLMKSEPDVFGIDDLKKNKTTHWDGVRNFQARNNLKAMQLGDGVLFYHSSTKPAGVAGIAEVCKTAYPDFTAFDPKDIHFDPRSKPEKPAWYMVDVKFVKKAKQVITADRLKKVPGLENMKLFYAFRLSVQPVSEQEWKIITSLPELK